MNFNITEHKVISKYKSIKYCEDRIVFNNDFVCVIDGATTKSDLLFDEKTSGLKVSEVLEESIHSLNEKSNIYEILNILSHSIKNFYSKNNLLKHMNKNPVDRLVASMAMYSKYHNQIWLIGDCQCMVENRNYSNNKLVDKLLSETRSFFITKEIIHGKSIKELQNKDTGREYILPLLKAQTNFQNNYFDSEYSYCVLDGFKINPKQVKIIDVNKNETIILASDGYPKLFNSLGESENYLKYILENDPLCYKLYKSTKGKGVNLNSFDDRAYVKIKINYH